MIGLELTQEVTGPLIVIGCLVIIGTIVEVIFRDFWGMIYLNCFLGLITFMVVWETSGTRRNFNK